MVEAPRAWTSLALLLVAGTALAQPLGSAFTHQGRLTDNGVPANGAYDFRCTLHDAVAGGTQVGATVSLDDVAVANGLFTIALDFGATAFRGSARFLEIAVRPGASTGAYTVLGGRQEMRPSPNAMWSASAPWSGVSGKPAGFADDVDDDSGGTVTAVATGAGLTGGPITGAGTVSVAPGGILSGMIANGAVGVGQINTTQVQARVGGVCPLGAYLRGINPDGSVVCTGIPNPHVITTADKPGTHDVGTHVSIAIGADGLPVVSHYGEINGGCLQFTKCGNLACSAGNAIRVLDDSNQNDVGQYSSIAIGSDGFPVVSYHDATLGTLKVAKCTNAACGGTVVVTTVDDHPVNTVGAYSSIAIGADGLPVISYYDSTARGLKVAKCVNVNCTGLNTITTVDDPGADVGRNTSIAIGTDGLPVISYRDLGVGGLRVAKCTTASCSSGVTITVGATPAAAGGLGDMVVPADGRPIISFEDTAGQNSSINVLKCGNPACSAGNVSREVFFAPGLGGANSSIALGADGLPILSHYGPSLRVAKCGDASCSSGNVLTVLDSPASANVGLFNAIALGSDGLPVVAYSDTTNGSLKVAKCGNVACN